MTPTDDYGRPVPQKLHKAFNASKEIRGLIRRLVTARKLTRQINSVIPSPQAKSVETAIASYVAYLGKSRPAAICPKCKGSQCQQCFRRGWITESEVVTLTADDLEYVKRFAGCGV